MEKWIGKRPTMGQKALLSKYENLLLQTENSLIATTDKVLKVIEAECDKASGRELDGVLILTVESLIFVSKREHMVYKYSQINDIRVSTDGKEKNEWQLTLSIGFSRRTFDDIKKNDDSQEFIEILEHKIINPDQEILTTVTHDFDYFLHAERLEFLRDHKVKITSFLLKRDDMGHSNNGQRLLQEKHKDAKLIVEGYYQEKKKIGNFIVVDQEILLYEYNNKERKVKLLQNFAFLFFTNSVIDHFAIKTVVTNEEGKLVLNSSGKKFSEILTIANIPFYLKKRKWHQKIIGFRSGKWWKKTIASLLYLFTLLMIIGIAFGEESPESKTIKPDAEVSNTETKKEEEATRLAEEKRKEEEAARLAEEKRKEEEVARLAEEKRKEEEAARLAEEKRKEEAAARLAEEKAQQTYVYYKNCTEARNAGAAPIHVGEPGYGKHLDRDGDGTGCDS